MYIARNPVTLPVTGARQHSVLQPRPQHWYTAPWFCVSINWYAPVAAKLFAIIAISAFRLCMVVCTLILYALLLAIVRAVRIINTVDPYYCSAWYSLSVRCTVVPSADLLPARSLTLPRAQLVCSSPRAINSHSHALAYTLVYSLDALRVCTR